MQVRNTNVWGVIATVVALSGVMLHQDVVGKRSPSRNEAAAQRAEVRKRGELLLLETKLQTLQERLTRGSEGEEENKAESKRLITECKTLCRELNIDDAEIEWGVLEEAVATGRALSPCDFSISKLICNINIILTKVCDIQTTVNALSACAAKFVNIRQVDLPFTIAAGTDDGKSYVVVESLTHTGASPAITINGEEVTVDFCGFGLAATTIGSPAVSISSKQVVVKNGHIRTDGTDNAISVLSTAEQVVIKDMTICVQGGTEDAIDTEGKQVDIHDIYIRMDAVAVGRAIHSKDPGGVISPMHLNRFSIDVGASNATTNSAVRIQSRGSTVQNGTIRFDRNLAFSDGAILMVSPGAGMNGSLVDNVFIVVKNPPGVKVDSGGDPFEGFTIKDVVVFANAVGATDPGILVNDNRQGVIQGCQITGKEWGVKIEGGSYDILVKDTKAEECTTGFEVLGAGPTNVTLENNAALRCTDGFKCTNVTDIIICNNTTSGSGSGIGYQVDATASRLTFERNKAMNHATGFSDAGASTVLFANNSAIGNTTNYAVAGFFAVAGPGDPPATTIAGATYWDNFSLS